MDSYSGSEAALGAIGPPAARCPTSHPFVGWEGKPPQKFRQDRKRKNKWAPTKLLGPLWLEELANILGGILLTCPLDLANLLRRLGEGEASVRLVEWAQGVGPFRN